MGLPFSFFYYQDISHEEAFASLLIKMDGYIIFSRN